MTKARKTTVSGRLTAVERLNNSYYGNPRFRLTWESIGLGTLVMAKNTASDASFVYQIGNAGFRVGDKVWLTIGGRGTVTGMEVTS